MTKPFKILVVCTGNICRSPVMAAMLAEMLTKIPEISVSSCGLNAVVRANPHPYAIATALELGISVNPFNVSVQIDSAMTDASDLILVMESAQRRFMTQTFPLTSAKLFLAGQWGQGEIPDPIGRSESYFRDVSEKLYTASESWARRIEAVELDSMRI